MPANGVRPRLHFPSDMPASAHAAIEAYFEYAQIVCRQAARGHIAGGLDCASASLTSHRSRTYNALHTKWTVDEWRALFGRASFFSLPSFDPQ